MLWYKHHEHGTKQIFTYVKKNVLRIQTFYRRVKNNINIKTL